MAQKRQSYRKKVFLCFLKNPNKQLKRRKKMLYTIAAVHVKKLSSKKLSFQSLPFLDFANTSCDNNSLNNATDMKLEIFRAVEV